VHVRVCTFTICVTRIAVMHNLTQANIAQFELVRYTKVDNIAWLYIPTERTKNRTNTTGYL
jgi:hypothetical protein